MFITYCKDVDGKKYDRYFKTWEAAENALQDGIKDVLSIGGKELSNKDYFNFEKGVQIRYAVLITDAHKYTLSLFASFFEDD